MKTPVALLLALLALETRASAALPPMTEADFDRMASAIVEVEVVDTHCVGQSRITDGNLVSIYESELRVVRKLRGEAPETIAMRGSNTHYAAGDTDAAFHAGWHGKIYLMPVEGRLGLVHPEARYEIQSESHPRPLPDCSGPPAPAPAPARAKGHGCSGCASGGSTPSSAWSAFIALGLGLRRRGRTTRPRQKNA